MAIKQQEWDEKGHWDFKERKRENDMRDVYDVANLKKRRIIEESEYQKDCFNLVTINTKEQKEREREMLRKKRHHEQTSERKNAKPTELKTFWRIGENRSLNFFLMYCDRLCDYIGEYKKWTSIYLTRILFMS